MNARFLTATLFLCAFCCLTQQADAQDRTKTSKYLGQASEALSGLMAKAEDDGLKLEKSMTLAGGWIDKSEKWTNLYQLYLPEGTTHRFMAAGDADATDVDIRLTDPDGNVAAVDDGVARTAVVNFTSKKSSYYIVQVRVYASVKNVPCVCLTAVYKR